LLVLLVFSASGRPSLAAPDPGFSYDKAAHFLVFGLIATSVARIGFIRRLGWRGAVVAAVAVSLYGALDEFRQSLTPGRSVEFADWTADTAGAFLAAFLYQGWARYRGLLEWRPFSNRPRSFRRSRKPLIRADFRS
jgi:VanZ family protein